MSDHKIFETTIEKNGYKYYVVPKGYPLFKALKTFRDPTDISLILKPNAPYFFGLKNLDPDYIYDYEEEYGVIFEYITTEPIELLALDDTQTINKLYNEPDTPSEIKSILTNNYMKTRLSESGPDRIFSNYLCQRNIFGNGYAIYEIETDFGGKFHPELMICNASKYVKYVKQITTDPKRIEEIIQQGKLKQMTDDLEQSRKLAKKNRQRSTNYNDDGFKPSKNLFGDDDDFNGGRKKTITKKNKLFIKRKNKKTNRRQNKKTSRKKFKHIKNK